MSTKRWNSSVHEASSSPLSMAEPLSRMGPYGVSSGVSMRQNDLPRTSVQRVKDICLHYVKKCSGKYTDNKTAARYVHQMADEVIGQLAGVIAQIKRYEAEPEIYQALLDDWEANFPPSLGAMGTPRAIANTLAKQAEEIRRLTNDLEAEKAKHQTDLNDVLRSMDSQLLAYRTGIVSERRQVAVAHELQVQEHEDKIKYLEAQIKVEKEQMQQSHQNELQTLTKRHSKEVRRLSSTIVHTEQAAVSDTRQIEEEFMRVLADRDALLRAAHEQIKSLQTEKVKDSGILATAKSDATTVVSLEIDLSESESEGDAVPSEEEEEEEEEEGTESESESSSLLTGSDEDGEGEGGEGDFSVDGEYDNDEGEDGLLNTGRGSRGSGRGSRGSRGSAQKQAMSPRHREKFEKVKQAKREMKQRVRQLRLEKKLLLKQARQQEKRERLIQRRAAEVTEEMNRRGKTGGKDKDKDKDAIRKKKKRKTIQITGVVAAAVKKLKDEISALSHVKGICEGEMLKLNEANKSLRHENDLLIRRLNELDSINENLRRALKLCLSQVDELRAAGKTVHPTVDPLCHTPHFIDTPDKTGLRANPRTSIIKGYQRPGHF